MACTPPLCYGTGGWCGCNCQCCPPSGCCTSVTQQFQCGTPSADYEGSPNDGCTCSTSSPFWAGLNLAEGELSIPMPNFSFDAEDEDEFVWALTNGCSIPCATVSVTITTTGCCLKVSGNSITVVGSGTVSASASGGGPAACGTLTANVNGTPNSAALNNCDAVTITLTSAETCCSCCVVSTTCTPMLFSPVMIRKTSINEGTTKSYLNKAALIERMQKLRRRK